MRPDQEIKLDEAQAYFGKGAVLDIARAVTEEFGLPAINPTLISEAEADRITEYFEKSELRICVRLGLEPDEPIPPGEIRAVE